MILTAGQTRMHGYAGALLLSLLVMCAFIGMKQKAIQTVSVPVTRIAYDMEQLEIDSAENARIQLNRSREKELELLQNVMQSASTDEELKVNALSQMTQIAMRMETEAKVQASLKEIGAGGVFPVASAQGMTLIGSADIVADEEKRLQIINTVCNIGGYESGDIKIIIAKK